MKSFLDDNNKTWEKFKYVFWIAIVFDCFGYLINYFICLNFQMKIGRRAMGALSVRYGTQYVTGNIAEAICKL